MSRLTSFAIALAAAVAVGFGGNAQAATLAFETVAVTTPPAGCAAPCFQVRMYFEDPTGTVGIEAIQFEVKVIDGVAADLPVPPATNANAIGGNGISGTTFQPGPWNLSTTVGKSPRTGFDALVVDAANTTLTVNSVAAAFPTCFGPPGDPGCAAILAGVPRKQIFLGAFNATLTGTAFEIIGLTGNGPAIEELLSLNGAQLTRDPADGLYRAPEPAGALLLGAALVGLSVLRRRD